MKGLLSDDTDMHSAMECGMKILIIGGSGLVGGRLLDLLAGSGQHDIKCLLRRPVNERKGIGQKVADVADWPHHAADFCPDILISTLGTTIRQAGSKAATSPRWSPVRCPRT